MDLSNENALSVENGEDTENFDRFDSVSLCDEISCCSLTYFLISCNSYKDVTSLKAKNLIYYLHSEQQTYVSVTFGIG